MRDRGRTTRTRWSTSFQSSKPRPKPEGSYRNWFDVTPMVMAFLLGPTIEYSLGQTLILAQGNFFNYIFVERPITAGLLLMTPVIAYLMWQRVARLRRDSERVAQS